MILLEAKPVEKVQELLHNAYIASAIRADDLARTCREIVIEQWAEILQIAADKPSAAATHSRTTAAIRKATERVIAAMAHGFGRIAAASASESDAALRAGIPQGTLAAAGLLEAEDDELLTELTRDPIKDWPGGKPRPLPPDPGPAPKVHYTDKREAFVTPAKAQAIIRRGKYRERMERWSGKITDKKTVSSLIAAGVGQGRSLKQIAADIEPHVQGLSSSAMRIARTEAARIHNEIAEENFKKYEGIIAGYRVTNPLDDVTRPDHRTRASEKNERGGRGRIYWVKEHAPKGAKYYADDRPELPDEPNCRCTYVPVLLDEATVVKSGKVPAHIRNKVDDIEHDVDEETLAKYREGQPKKARAGIRNAGDAVNEKLIGTAEYKAAQERAAKTRAALDKAREERKNAIAADVRYGSSVATTSDQIELKEWMAKLMPVDDVLRVTGVQDGAKVMIRREGPDAIVVNTDHAGYKSQRTLVFKNGKPDTIVNNTLDVTDTGQGLGLKIFAQQVAHGEKMGFKKIETTAGGYGTKHDYHSDMNGYYTWPRFGYDANLKEIMELQDEEYSMEFDDGRNHASDFTKALKKTFPTAKRISDLMKTPEGRQWWLENGVEHDAQFDLKPGSLSRKILESYLEQKKKKLEGR